MPQLRHQGKHIFAWSIIRKDNTVCLPPELIKEYHLEKNSDIILFNSSKTSGGFCISKLETLKSSKLSKIIENNHLLEDEENIGQIIEYKGRSYCHLKLNDQDGINLSQKIMNHFNLKIGYKLLIIRGSDIAFDCILKGPLVKVANETNKEIKIY